MKHNTIGITKFNTSSIGSSNFMQKNDVVLSYLLHDHEHAAAQCKNAPMHENTIIKKVNFHLNLILKMR